jgi:hypothetical protein
MNKTKTSDIDSDSTKTDGKKSTLNQFFDENQIRSEQINKLTSEVALVAVINAKEQLELNNYN